MKTSTDKLLIRPEDLEVVDPEDIPSGKTGTVNKDDEDEDEPQPKNKKKKQTKDFDFDEDFW